MSDDDDCCLHLNIHDNAAASDDDSNTASVGSSTRLSDDSGIEDWSDDMTVQTELQQPLRDEKHNNSPIVELLNTSISPIKDEATIMPTSTECIFPMLPELYSVHDAKAESKTDMLSDDAVPGVAGLYNLGNTCFMNAALQCLFVTRSLRDLVREGNLLQNGSDHMDEPANVLLFVERFQELFQKVLAGKYSVVRPDQFHSSLARLHPTLGDYKQHDSQEFLSFLLNILHELLNRGRGKLRNIHHNSEQNNGSTSSDFSDSISGDVSMKRLKMDSDVDDSTAMEPDAGVDCEENVSKSEAAWRAYTATNQSQIVDSFHGQFQSVIICDKCSFISTTYEPFMSLSLPIPHAMEKQFIITWVPSLKLAVLPGMISAIKYCITVSKNATCGDLKSAFLAQRRKSDDQLQSDHIVLVEAKQSANVSVLDDRTQISYISKSKDIYAIEVVQESEKSPTLSADLFADDINVSDKEANMNMSTDVYSNGHLDSGMVTPDENSQNNTQNMDLSDASFNNNNNNNNNSNGDCVNGSTVEGTGSSGGVEGAATWHSCGICLEEIYDEELRVHVVCGGLLCDPCLTNMIEVLNSDRFPCPICNRYISREDYTPLVEPKQNGSDSNGVKKEVVRQILVPVLFRHDLADATNAARKFKLFGHPVIASLPSQVETNTVLEVVNQSLKNLSFASLKFDVVITDGTGLSCGFCDLFSTCSGCPLKDDGTNEILKLKPGCCISVHFHDNVFYVAKTLAYSQEDASMEQFRNSDTVALEECLAKFGDTEVLTKDNPWYCTKCQTNQIAVKNMTVTRWPETLVIHLKRFYFEGNQCCKIECPVVFPMKGLNIDMLTCADGNMESSTYDLYSFICHSGTLFGGHYTAHAKTDIQADWNYFNDESFEKMDPPSDEENQKAYVLFYQRKGTM